MTIWFRPHGCSGALSVLVENVDYARVVWDGLEVSFHMMSARP
jgi:hypothetical protein